MKIDSLTVCFVAGRLSGTFKVASFLLGIFALTLLAFAPPTSAQEADGGASGSLAKINFQPQTANSRGEGQTSGGTPVPVPDGYTPDYGEAFDADRGYGWIDPNTGDPVDARLNTRYRSASGAPSDLRLATQMQMQGTGGANQPVTNGAWEYAVPNGTYDVTLSVGDQPFDSTHRINVEGRRRGDEASQQPVRDRQAKAGQETQAGQEA